MPLKRSCCVVVEQPIGQPRVQLERKQSKPVSDVVSCYTVVVANGNSTNFLLKSCFDEFAANQQSRRCTTLDAYISWRNLNSRWRRWSAVHLILGDISSSAFSICNNFKFRLLLACLLATRYLWSNSYFSWLMFSINTGRRLIQMTALITLAPLHIAS